MRATLKALTEGLRGLEVIVDKTTHLGRAHFKELDGRQIPRDSSAETKRRLPPEYRDVELVILIDDVYPSVSRNHALLVPRGDEYILIDLESLNGTSLNDKSLSPEKEYPLKSGDRISLANGLGVEFKFQYEEIKTELNQALLVGYDGRTLRGVHNDLHYLELALAARKGFSKNITVLEGTKARKEKVIEALEHLQRSASSDSTTIFYFSGHGGIDGNLCLPWLMGLSPEELYGYLREVRGKKVVIADSCFSGRFIVGNPLSRFRAGLREVQLGVPLLKAFANQRIVPPNTLVITATEARSFAYEQKYRVPGDISSNLYMGSLTNALLWRLYRDPTRLNLKDLGQSLRLPNIYDTPFYGSQRPLAEGSTVYLRSQVVPTAKK